MADERTRYSDAELEEFKQLILKKLENARADYELLRATITHTADNDTEDTSPTFKVLEEGNHRCRGQSPRSSADCCRTDLRGRSLTAKQKPCLWC